MEEELIGTSLGVFETIEWHDVEFKNYGSAYVSISKCGGKTTLNSKETQPPKGLTKQQVNDFIYENWNVSRPNE